jgi:hypothetical protein
MCSMRWLWTNANSWLPWKRARTLLAGGPRHGPCGSAGLVGGGFSAEFKAASWHPMASRYEIRRPPQATAPPRTNALNVHHTIGCPLKESLVSSGPGFANGERTCDVLGLTYP